MVKDIKLPALQAEKSIILIVIGMGAYFAYLYSVGFQNIIDSLANVNFAIFSVAFLLALLGMLFYAIAWKKVCEQLNYDVSTLDVFLMYMSSIFFNNLIPSGSFSGESARIYFLNKITKNSRFDMSSATVAATRIITAIPLITGTIIGLTYLTLRYDVPGWALATCFVITLFLVCIGIIFVGICFAETWLEGIITVIIKVVERIFHTEIDREFCYTIVRQFHDSMNSLTSHRRALLVSTLWAVFGWLSINMVAFVAFMSMGIEVPLLAIFAVYTVMIVLQMLPIVLPGGVGFVDIVMMTLFAAVGVPMHDAAAATILTRSVQLWFLTAVGGVSTAHLVRKINHTKTAKSF